MIVSAGFASNAGGWSDVGKSFTIDTAIWQLHKPLHCQASFYLRNLSGDYYYPDGTYDSSGRIEVIDSPTWTYIATKDYSVLDQTNYVKVITDSWSPPSQTFFVRVGVLDKHPGYSQSRIQVDDFSLVCLY